MNTYIFLYQETSFFEVDLVAYFMKTRGSVVVVTDENKKINTNEGVKILADISVDEVDVHDVDVLIICGGNIDNINNISKLYELIRTCHKNEKIIGGICAGREIIAQSLNIMKITNTTEVIDKIVLSPGNEYVDFALEIGKLANIYIDEADYIETVNYFKRFNTPQSTF